MPAPTEQAELAGWVQGLAPTFGQPAFVPHLTIQGDLSTPLEALEAQARALAASCTVQRWPVQSVESTAHFFRCLYLRFEATPAFTALQQGAQAITGTAQGLSPYPHLSLAYGQMQPERQSLAKAVQTHFAGRSLVFDRISICLSSKDIPIADWACLRDYPLAPAAA